jgi:hypothetical protein
MNGSRVIGNSEQGGTKIEGKKKREENREQRGKINEQ